MSPATRRRVASIITTIIMGYIFYRVLDRLFVVILVQVPWWGFILMAVLLFLAIDYLVNRVLTSSEDAQVLK